jgi:hypothetical protein
MKISGSNSIEVAASAERCRAVLLDFDSYVEWFPGVRESRALDAGGPSDSGSLVFSSGMDLLPEVSCTLRYDTSVADRLKPVVIEGSLGISGPGWLLKALSDERTTVSYEVQLEMSVPGGFLAERALAGPARRYLIEQPAERLRERAESLG